MSTYAVPLTCKFLQFLSVEPKSKALCTSGTIDELISAPNLTVSVLASPTVMLPPNVILPSIFALPLKYKLEPVILPVTVNPPVISVLVLTFKPPACDIEAVALPSEILFNSNPVIPLAGIL
ncbi:hypothetical protein DCBHLPFO_00695 [Mycoplasmopsis arginini]|uniref:Uncharacterized protein n=1 Tax=Mycoplasmopsis arginini TaxID=2094 RepID=A0AA43U1I5_MYCAR|nr:hypothetical protein [Mycoplasmopsis arginini]